MQRREYLALLGGAAAAAATAGCVSSGDGGGGETIVADAPAEPNDDGELTLEEIWYYLENAQETMGISVSPAVHDVRIEDAEMQISIEFQGNLQHQRVEQLAAPALMYAAYLDENGEPDSFQGYVVDAFGEEQQTFHCESDWAEQYANEEVTGNELADRVARTLQPA